jgi:transcriptional regulator with XRE-family HTH domain
METIGSKIKTIRKKQRLTQEDLARKAGIPYATLLKIENNYVINPTIKTIKKIADALGVSLDNLVK